MMELHIIRNVFVSVFQTRLQKIWGWRNFSRRCVRMHVRSTDAKRRRRQ